MRKLASATTAAFLLGLCAPAWSAPTNADSELENAISEVPGSQPATPAAPGQTLKVTPAPAASPSAAQATAPAKAGLRPDPLAIPIPNSATLSAAPLPLIDILSAEKNPGRGTLEYFHGGGETEKIAFGADSGHYLLGMVFSHDTLPRSLQAEFKNCDIVQLAMGSVGGTAEGKVSQFGTATLKVLRQVTKIRTLPLRIPGVSEAPLPESAFLLFTSPGTASAVSDEDKLKNTFFAREGALTLIASAEPKSLQVPLEGRKIPFKMQAMRMEVQATLSTPFNNEEHRLQGTVEFPIYWPEGTVGKRIAREMAEAAFNAKSSIQIPEEFSASRQLTTEPRSRPRPSRRRPTSRH